MPQAAANISAAKRITPPAPGFAPRTSTPAQYRTMVLAPSAAATYAATVTAPGRVPGSTGSSEARIASARSRARADPLVRGGSPPAGMALRLRLRRPNERSRRGDRVAQAARRDLGVGRLGDRAHDHDPPGPGGDAFADV